MSKLMDMVWVCFTCRRDVGLLPLHAEAIRRVDPRGVIWYVVDKADEDMPLPDGCERRVTDWPRRGNLLGFPALVGILETLRDAAATGRVPVKVDSDVVMRGVGGLEHLRRGKTGMVGVCPGQLFCASGACYGIAPHVVQEILRFIESRAYWDAASIRVEDETISMMAALVSPPYGVTFLQHRAPDGAWVLSSIFNKHHFQDASLLVRCQAYVDCGDRKFLQWYQVAEDELPNIKKQAMETVLQALSAPLHPRGKASL